MIKILFHPYRDSLTQFFCEHINQIDKKKLNDFSYNLNYGEHKLFVDWLFSEGIILKRENKKQYLLFLDEQQALMFMMKWGVYD